MMLCDRLMMNNLLIGEKQLIICTLSIDSCWDVEISYSVTARR